MRHLLPLKGSSLSFSYAFSVASSPPRKLGLATIWSAAGYNCAPAFGLAAAVEEGLPGKLTW